MNNPQENKQQFDVNKPVENPTLSLMLSEIRKIDSNNKQLIGEHLDKIAREIATNAKLLSIVKIDKKQQDSKSNLVLIEKGATIAFALQETADNKKILPLYTDWNEIRKNKEYQNEFIETVILSFEDIWGISQSLDTGIIINPFGNHIIFTKEDLEYMKQRKDAENNGYYSKVTTKATEVKISEPKDYPTDMVNAISNYAKDIKEINAIWLTFMTQEEPKEESFLLIVDFKGDKDNIFKGIVNVAKEFVPKNMFLDMVPYQDNWKNFTVGKPFYKKKKRFLWF